MYICAFYRELEEKHENISHLKCRLFEETSLATQDILQKAEVDLRVERDLREKLEYSLNNLQITLQTIEVQHSEFVTYILLFFF